MKKRAPIEPPTRPCKLRSSGPAGAVITPFPLTRRQRLIATTAERIARMPAAKAESVLASTVGSLCAALARKQVPTDLVEKERQALEGAIRGAYWRAVITPGGRA